MPSTPSKKTLIVPILMIAIGVGWLLTVQGVIPQVNWIYSLGTSAIGLLCFILFGFDKVSIVLGPFFLVASLLSVLRQTGQISLDSELPILVIVIGILLLIARFPFVPMPNWIDTSEPAKGS